MSLASDASAESRQQPLLAQPAPTHGSEAGISLPAMGSSSPVNQAPPLEHRECRLCFEGGGELLAPCQCSGSMRWVHRSCLDKWRYHGQFTNPKTMSHCPTCDFRYKLHCTFDVGDQERRKRKRCLRFCRDSALVFVIAQCMLFLLALLLMAIDNDGKFILRQIERADKSTPVVHHPFSDLFKRHLFLYWSAAMVLTLFLIGLGTAMFQLINCCCPDRCCRRPSREIRFGARRRGWDCCEDCASGCWWMGNPWLCGTCDIASCDCCAVYACEGEMGLVILGLAAAALVVLGLFVALVLFSMFVQRSGQGYLRVLHLKDVAERYAVRDLSQEAPEPERMAGTDPEAGVDAEQDEIHRLMDEEVKLARGRMDEERNEGEQVLRDLDLDADEELADFGGYGLF